MRPLEILAIIMLLLFAIQFLHPSAVETEKKVAIRGALSLIGASAFLGHALIEGLQYGLQYSAALTYLGQSMATECLTY